MTQVMASPSIKRIKTIYTHDRKKSGSFFSEKCRRSDVEEAEVLFSTKDLKTKEHDTLLNPHKELSSQLKANLQAEWSLIVKSTENMNQLYKNFETMAKNRYTSVHPVEKTRVKLLPRKWCSDYINANYVDGIHKNGENFYIATQAPTVTLFDDFWRMVFEQDVSVIVMLTRLVESGHRKADRYWPLDGSVKYCNVTVSLITVEEYTDFEIRKFVIEMDGVSKTVTHYYYLGWPDHGVPQSSDSFLNMLLAVQKLQDLSSGPLLLHCSAGIGRTGSFIAIDTVIRFVQENDLKENNVNMVELIKKIRSHRDGSLTHVSQYEFCYDAIDEFLVHKNTYLH